VCSPQVSDRESAAGRLDGLIELCQEAAREMQMSQVLLVTADQPRSLVSGEAEPLALVEKRVVQRGQVLELGEERWR